MSWTSKLVERLGAKIDFGRLKQEEPCPDQERILATLLENPSVAGNQKIADFFLREGEKVEFKKGDVIIRQGANDSDVYFLIVGKVDVKFKHQGPSIRAAPNQVGELAAIEPGQCRTATVVCRTDTVWAIKVPGQVVHKRYNEDADFRSRLEKEKTRRFRERITVNDQQSSPSLVQWLLISIFIGGTLGIIFWLLLNPIEWMRPYRFSCAVAGASIAFLWTFIRNPAFTWRWRSGIVLASLIGYVMWSAIPSFEARGEAAGLFVNLTSAGAAPSIAVLIVLFLTLLVCAIMDWMQNRNN